MLRSILYLESDNHFLVERVDITLAKVRADIESKSVKHAQRLLPVRDQVSGPAVGIGFLCPDGFPLAVVRSTIESHLDAFRRLAE